METVYVKREIETLFIKHLKSFSVVAVSGARQTGKTTLLRHLLKKTHDFISLDDLNKRNHAVKDPKGFVDNLKEHTVIDEIQYAPEILSYIKLRVDNNRLPRGNFVLTGSQQFLMMKGLSETLAGRVGILNLHPFSVREIEKEPINTTNVFKKFILRSSYPEPLVSKDVEIQYWYDNYTNAYIEKDVRLLYNIGDAAAFTLFLKLLALRMAQPLNMSTLAVETGVSVPTIKSWLSIMEAGNLIFLLNPYHRNIKKRLVKNKKVYFYDTALAFRLCGLSSNEQLFSSVMLGQLFENFCISEARKAIVNTGAEAQMYYIRTNLGLEVDLAVEKKGKFSLYEIKATKSVSESFGGNILEAEKSIIPVGICDKCAVVTMNDESGFIPGGVEYFGIGKFIDSIV